MDDDLKSMVARIDERTLAMKNAQEIHIESTQQVLQDHEHRLRKTETVATRVTAYALLLGAVVTGVIQATIRKISG